ncbi:Na-translocating system protein MpsC family protein [Fredinandcohnia sp. 179-A 10B2 NHS]|uniref:Na-translocating system protein MpsC family protein n=1 Tax=Fredinandcohnia sp. 179-A 10B2 NHS TaxID=3235176 RepID=UPI0039A0DF79
MKSTIHKQEELTYISSFISKLIKTKFGKGPETCYTTFSDNYVVVHVRRFMTQIEEELINKNENKAAKIIRTSLTEDLFEGMKEKLQERFEKTVSVVYQDWNFSNNSGILLFVLEGDACRENRDLGLKAELLKNEIVKRSEFSFNQPREFDVTNLGNDIYIARCAGYLVPVERTIYEKGYLYLLEEREIEIRNNYLKNIGRFERILLKELDGVFLVWDYQEDVLYTIFYCK